MSENLSDHEQITCNNIKTLLSQKIPNISGEFIGNIDNFLNFYNYISNHIERIISPSKASSSLNCLEMPYVLLTFNVNNIKNDSPLSEKIYEYKYLLNKYDIDYNEDKTNIITFNLGENCSWISPESNVIASYKQITFELSKNNIIENSINDDSENNSDDSEQYCLKVRAIAPGTGNNSIDLVTIFFNKKIFTKENIIEKNLGLNIYETFSNKIINIRLECFKCNADPINELCKKKYIYDRRKRCYILYDDYINCNC
jgi:hypothetical protein